MQSVSLIGVRKSFGETKALVDVNLVALSGQVHAIVGENGSGKSTLAKIMSGVIMPDAGTVNIFGATPRNPREAISNGVATIYQEVLLAERLTVQENLFAGRDGFWRRRVADAEKRRVATDILKRLVGETVDPGAMVETLPLSVRQWIVIARAMISQPRLLIVDESSAALDLDATGRLHAEMRRLKAEGCCILLVTHRIAELVRVADAATVLRDGVTVGCLERSDITEDRLLDLMSASTVPHGKHTRPRPGVARPPVLSANDVALLPSGATFDFSLAPGEIVGLTGLDGAGHEAFVRMLAGIQPPAAGSIVVRTKGETTIHGLAQASDLGIAYVSGDRKREGIFPRLSIVENFGVALMSRHSGRGGLIDTRQRAKDFIREVARLSIKFGKDGDRITTLSGGNQQKVLIARAFAQNPKIIVLNDPARGVDIGTKQDLYRHLKAFAADGGSVAYLSSEIEEFLGFADRVDVFFERCVFASLSGADIEEHRILTALFGHRGSDAFEVMQAETA